MRLIFKLLILTLTTFPVFAQSKDVFDHPIKSVYGVGGYPYAFHEEFLPIYGGAGVVFKSNWGFELIYTSQGFETDNRPEDYKGGFCFWEPCTPKVLNSWTLPINKNFTSPDHMARLKFGVGPALIMYHEPQFTKAPPFTGIFNFSSNYDLSYKTHYLPGLCGQFRAEFLAATFLGLGVGFSFKINKEISYISIDSALLLGYMRPSLKKLKTIAL